KGDPQRDDAYQLFLLSVQVAVVASPVVCGTLGEKVGFHWGFGAAGVGMLIGLAVYLFARPTLPSEPERTVAARERRPPLTPLERRNLAVLAAMVPVLSLIMVGNQQFFVAYVLWAKQNLQLSFHGFEMPATWLFAIAAVLSSGSIIASMAFWRWWNK